MSWTQLGIAQTLFVALAVHRLWIIIYNAFFHPLAAFPGPVLAKVTTLWRAYVELYGTENFTTDTLVALHARYGDVVRVAPNELHFATPQAYHDIYNAKNRWDKDAKLYNALRGSDGHASFHLARFRDAKQRREPMIPLFSRSSIMSMQHLLNENLDTLCAHLARRDAAGETTDLLLAMRAFALDTVTAFCFGTPSVHALSAPGFDAPLGRVMTLIMTFVPSLKHFPVLHWMLNHMPPALVRAARPELTVFYEFHDIIAKQVDHALNDPDALAAAPHPTVYHALLDQPHASAAPAAPRAAPALSFRELCAEAHLLAFAGTDTASNTLTYGVTSVLSDARVHRMLVAALRDAWPDLASPPRYEELEKVPYLKAVVRESLRCLHGVLSPMDRVVPAEGAVVAGSFIPGGTVVGISNIFVHLSPEIFHDPLVFLPERWLADDADTLEPWLVAFSKGPRSCLGINLGYCELFLLFAHLFRRFELSLVDVSAKDMVWDECYLPHYAGPSLQIRAKPVDS